MIVVADVGQFMDHHVAEGVSGTDDQAPVEGQGAGGRTGTPPGSLVSDRYPAGLEFEPGRLEGSYCLDPLACLTAIPAINRTSRVLAAPAAHLK